MANTRKPLLKSKLTDVYQAVARGNSIAEGFARTGDYFPPLQQLGSRIAVF